MASDSRALHDHSRRAVLMALGAAALGGQAWAQQASTGTRVGGLTPPEGGDMLDAWVDAYGRPTARVSLNGQPGFRFMVDTGSNITVLAMRHAVALGVKFQGAMEVNGTTGTAQLPVAMLDRLSTGAVGKEGLRVAVLSDQQMGTEDGILGADVFAGRRLVFDIPAKTVRVETSRRDAKVASPVTMRVRNGMLAEVDGRIGRVSTRFMLDTGAQNCIVNPKLNALLAKAYPRMKRHLNARVRGVTGQEIIGEYLELPELKLGKVNVKYGGAVAADAPIFKVWGLDDEPAMIVGVNVLSRAASFTIDYGARQFDARPMAELMARQMVMLG